MPLPVLIFLYLFILIALLYCVLITYYTFGWFKTKGFSEGVAGNCQTKVSVLIPARNEELNILNCLRDILNQDYNVNLMEIIVIDDFSEDGTVKLVRDFIDENPGRIIQLIELKDRQKQGNKKLAISAAMSQAQGHLMICTDADCRMGKEWIRNIVCFYEENKPAMIVAPVCFYETSSLFENMQQLEFLSYIASSAASIKQNFPILCSGANLIYEKTGFSEVGGYEGNQNILSGDDVFLMHKFRQHGKKIMFLKAFGAIVFTKAPARITDFLSQRKRWISKTRRTNNISIFITGLLVFLMNFSLMVSFMLSIFIPGFFYYALGLFILKIVMDMPIMTGIAWFMKRSFLMWFYLPVQILNMVYIPAITVMGLFGNYEWKGRKS